jgi:integrase
MPRHVKEPHLIKRKARYDKATGRLTHHATWIIKDGDSQTGTGCGVDDVEGAKRALHEYNVKKYAEAPLRAGLSDDEVLIGDLIRYYLEANADWVGAKKPERKREYVNQVARLNEFWGSKTVSEIDTLTSKKFQKDRTPNTVLKELEILRSMIYFGEDEGKVKLSRKPNFAMPEKPEPRVHYLTEDEVWKLIKGALNRFHTFNGKKTHRVSVHIAIFIIVAVTTGTRSERIFEASFEYEPGRPWIDLDSGIFYRRPGEKFVPSNKRANPCQLPDDVLSLLRRIYREAKRKNIDGAQYLIRYQGRAVDPRKGFYTLKNEVFDEERAAQINRHTLKHTCATYLLKKGLTIDEVADYLSTTSNIIRKVYGHLIPGQHRKASLAFSKVGRKRSANAPSNQPPAPSAPEAAVVEITKSRPTLRVVGGTAA